MAKLIDFLSQIKRGHVDFLVPLDSRGDSPLETSLRLAVKPCSCRQLLQFVILFQVRSLDKSFLRIRGASTECPTVTIEWHSVRSTELTVWMQRVNVLIIPVINEAYQGDLDVSRLCLNRYYHGSIMIQIIFMSIGQWPMVIFYLLGSFNLKHSKFSQISWADCGLFPIL